MVPRLKRSCDCQYLEIALKRGTQGKVHHRLWWLPGVCVDWMQGTAWITYC